LHVIITAGTGADWRNLENWCTTPAWQN